MRWWETALAASADTLRPLDLRFAQLTDPPGYTTRKAIAHLRRKAATVAARFPSVWPDPISSHAQVRILERVRTFLNDPERLRTLANETYITNELGRSRAFFNTVEAHPLTEEQRNAVVIDETCNLVIAAAGSGKTSVIVAKAGWLLRRGYRQASELLLLAFARDARTEMQERIRHRLGDETVPDITVQTFHQLGKSIIGQAERKSPTLAKVAEDHKALFDLLKSIVSDLLADPNVSAILLNWFQDKFAPYRSEHEFRSFGEYWDYIRRYEIRSLQGEKVKSFEECEIANFLYLNGVPYEYERAYDVETATADKQQYQPDFYLTEAGIYLEHFAVTASGDTPAFIDRDEYLSGMEWKRRLHDAHGTTLIETYSHEAAAGRLTENLAAKLQAHDIALSPIPPDEVFGASPWRDRDAHPGRRASSSNPERARPARAHPASRLDPSSRTLRPGHPKTGSPSRSGLDQPTRDIQNRRDCSVNRNRQCLKVVDRFRCGNSPSCTAFDAVSYASRNPLRMERLSSKSAPRCHAPKSANLNRISWLCSFMKSLR